MPACLIARAADKRAPKKLSDVKVDPKFASTISGLASQQQQKEQQSRPVFGLAPPPSARGGLALPPSQPSRQAAAIPPPPPANPIDLLGDFACDPTPAAPPPAPLSSGGGAFSMPPLPPAARPAAPADGFDLLSGFGAASALAPRPAATPAFNDPFGAVFGAAAVQSSRSGAAAAAFNDPFAALAAAPAQKVRADAYSSEDVGRCSPCCTRHPVPVFQTSPFETVISAHLSSPQAPAAAATGRAPLEDLFATPTSGHGSLGFTQPPVSSSSMTGSSGKYSGS